MVHKTLCPVIEKRNSTLYNFSCTGEPEQILWGALVDQLFTFSWRNRVISAHNACIFYMGTIMFFPTSVTTSSNALLITATLDIIHPNGKGFVSRTKVTHMKRPRKVQHLTDNCSLPQAPVIITNGSPFAFIIYFNTTLVRRIRSTKTYFQICKKEFSGWIRKSISEAKPEIKT